MEWFRAYHGISTDPKWRLIARKSGQPVHVVLAVWLSLLDRASQSEERGSIAGVDTEVLDVALDLPDGAAQAVLDSMQAKGLVVDDRLAAWDKRQPKREESDNPEAMSNAERSRRSRERKKQHNAAQCSEAQHNAAQCSEAQHNAAQCSEAQRLEEIRREEKRKEREDTHTESHDLYAPQQAQCACASSPPLNGEDIAERRDAAQAQHRRGDYEFRLVRDAYDAVKAEAPQAGYPEFLRLYNSTEWRAGMHEEILAGLDALAKGDRQFLGEERYRPGLAKFLTQEIWKMKPRAPDGQSGVKTPEEEELERRVQENERKMRQRMAERKKLLG